MTPPGIDPGTVPLVVQRLNHYATPTISKMEQCVPIKAITAPFFIIYTTQIKCQNFQFIVILQEPYLKNELQAEAGYTFT